MQTIPVAGRRARAQGILDAMRDVAASVWEHLGTRFDLLVLELTEERVRLVRGITAGALAIAGVALAAAFGGIALLAWFWETPNRMLAAVALPVAFAVGAVIAARIARSMLGRESLLFRTSMAEFQRDVDALRLHRDHS